MQPPCFPLLLLVLAANCGKAFFVGFPGISSCRSSGRQFEGPKHLHTTDRVHYDASRDRRPYVRRRRHSHVRMAKEGPPYGTTKNLGSYYRRPSAAIEQGGGFFVPGLQGFRLRFVLAAVILGLLSLDGVSRPGMTTSQVVSEVLAGIAGFALFGQALLDQQKEQAVQMRREAIAAAPSKTSGEGGQESTSMEGEVSFFDSTTMGSDLEGRVRWAADILLQLTAGCSLVVFSEGKVLARVGATGGESDDASVTAIASRRAARAATAAAASADPGQYQGSSVIATRKSVSSQPSTSGDESSDLSYSNSGFDAHGDDDAIMQLLPNACRQGILCTIRSAGTDEGGAVPEDVAVLLGSTLRGNGVFSGLDGVWFERVCAHLSLSGGFDVHGGDETSER